MYNFRLTLQFSVLIKTSILILKFFNKNKQFVYVFVIIFQFVPISKNVKTENKNSNKIKEKENCVNAIKYKLLYLKIHE